MDDGRPTLEIGFAIETGSSFDELQRLQAIMNSTEANVLKAAGEVERATGKMINIGDQTASINAFASTTSAAFNKAEAAAERMTAKLTEQVATFGMTRAAAAAWRAEQAGATDAAAQLLAAESSLNALRQQEVQRLAGATQAYDMFEAAARRGAVALREVEAAERSAAADALAQETRAAAAAYQMFEAAARKGAVALREMEAAERATAAEQVSLAASAAALRASLDPMYAAQQRFDVELTRAQSLLKAGVISTREYDQATQHASATLYAHAQSVAGSSGASAEKIAEEAAAVAGLGGAHVKLAAGASLSRIQMLELGHVATALTDSLAAGVNPARALFMEMGRLGQVASYSEGGFLGLARTLGVMFAPVIAPLTAVGVAAGFAFAAFKQFQGQVKDSGELTRYRDSLGLTHKQMLELSDGTEKVGDKIKKLTDVTVTAGDVMAGLWKTIEDGARGSFPAEIWEKIKSGAVSAFNGVLGAWSATAAGITAGIYGTFDAVKTVWKSFPAVFGDLFVQGANAAISALNLLVKAGINELNGFIATANRIAGTKFAPITAPTIAPLENANAGAAVKAAKQIADGYVTEYARAKKADADFWHQVGANAKQHAKDRMSAEAQALKDNETPHKPKVDHNALNAEAVEAQIRNLYKLADAYSVSGAAALIAEAREKAESQAIKSRADVAAAVDRQIRLAIAQRVADAQKSVASMRDQTLAQQAVNAVVASGLIPASAASEELAKHIALLPIKAALEASTITGDIKGQQAAAKAISDTTSAINQQNAAKADARALAANDQAQRSIDAMKLELSLIGSSNRERAIAIAGLRAQQEVEATMRDADPAYVARFIQLKKDEAAAGVALTLAQDSYNQGLTATLDLMRQLEDRAGVIGTLLSDSFGQAGSALGNLVKSLAAYQTKETEIAVWKEAENRKFAGDAAQLARIESEAAMRSQTARIDGIGSTISAAKNLFDQHSAGYAAMEAAEKAFALVQLANTAVNLAAGAAKMFSSLGPFGFAAVAAMVGVMASLGFNSGGGSADPTLYADAMQKAQGTGSVLGDTTAKSSSISHALDLVAKNTNAQLEYSSKQLAALRSIETNIGALSSTLAKQLGLSGGSFDTTKLGLGNSTSVSSLATLGLGGIWSQIPVIGGLINSIAKALFGTTTTKTLVDQGVQFYAATLGQVLKGGIEGASYQLVEIVKKSHFLGITTGTSTSYQTYTSALDSSVKTQTSLLLTSIYSSVVDAATTVGLSGVEDLLKNYTVALGKISLDGLKGSEITDAISAVFSKAGDDMAAYVLPGIAAFQKVGEGLFETLQRVAKDFTTIDVEMQSIGRTFGAVGLSSLGARESLIDLFGSLDEFVSETDFYRQHFLTEAQQIAPVMTAVDAELSRLGLSGVTTVAQFKAVVDGLDLTTDAGRTMYAALMGVAQGFYAVDQYQAAITSKRADLEIQLMQAQGNAAGALAAQRASELAAMDASLRGLQQQIYLYQDIATARDTLTTAYNAEKDALSATAKTFGDFAASLTTFRDTLTGSDTGLTTYTAQLAKLMATGSLAAAGDQTALGNLQGVSTQFLSIAKDNAGSLAQYRRDVALVTGYVNGGIGAANDAVDYAQAQLAALDQSVSGLIDINKSVISVHDAIIALEQLLATANPSYSIVTNPSALSLDIPDAPASSTSTSTATASNGATMDDLEAALGDIRTALEAIKVDTGKQARLQDRWDGDGLPIRSDPSGEPLLVHST